MQDGESLCLQTDETVPSSSCSTTNLGNSPLKIVEDLTKDYKCNIAIQFPQAESDKKLRLTRIESIIKNATGSVIDLDFLRAKVLDTHEAEIMLMDFANLASMDLRTLPWSNIEFKALDLTKGSTILHFRVEFKDPPRNYEDVNIYRLMELFIMSAVENIQFIQSVEPVDTDYTNKHEVLSLRLQANNTEFNVDLLKKIMNHIRGIIKLTVGDDGNDSDLIGSDILDEHVENIKSEIEDEYDEDFDYEPEVKIQKFEPLSDSEECDQAVTEYYQKCDQCDYVGKNDELLRRHKNRMHLEKKKNCDICSVQCEDEDQLALHMTEHFDPLENKYKCDQCDYKGELLKHLKKHKYAQHRGDIVQCDACSKTFKSRNALNLHRMRHHNFEKPFKCDICDFATVTTNDLKRHKIATHSETKSEICHICGKGFYLNSLLKIHIKTIHERIDQKLKCEKCPTSSRTYPDLKSLDTHLKIVHNFVILCTLCEKVFPSKLRLSKHINKEHNIECDKDKMFICPQCKLSHTSSHTLNEHLRTQHNLINEH